MEGGWSYTKGTCRLATAPPTGRGLQPWGVGPLREGEGAHLIGFWPERHRLESLFIYVYFLSQKRTPHFEQ